MKILIGPNIDNTAYDMIVGVYLRMIYACLHMQTV